MKRLVERILAAFAVVFTFVSSASAVSLGGGRDAADYIFTNRLILLGVAIVALIIAYFANRPAKSSKKEKAMSTTKCATEAK